MDDLVKTALLGTAKGAATPLNADHPVDALFTLPGEIPAEDQSVEDQLLLRAGAHAIFEQAGSQFSRLTAVEPAPPETGRIASRKMAGLLRHVWNSERRDLLGEFIDQLRAVAVMLPPEVLTEALSVQIPAFRERLFPILGARGHWLASWQEAWHWGTPEGYLKRAESLPDLRHFWEEGDLSARVSALQRARQIDASSARSWLAETWKQDKADDRRTFLSALKISLSMQDEAFLDAALKDRSEGVRQTAVELLTLLSESAWAGRMRQRADQLLSLEQTGILKKTKRLHCLPPEELPDDWARDGIAKAPPAGTGKRAFWTQSVLRCVSPTHWEERFSLSAEQLLVAIAEDEYADAVIAGWTRAAASFLEAGAPLHHWLAPLWEHWFAAAQKKPNEDLSHVLLIVQASPQREAERFVQAWLETDHHTYRGLSLLSTMPTPWSPEFARFCLERAAHTVRTRDDMTGWHWAGALSDIARNIPRDLLSTKLTAWETDVSGTVVTAPPRAANFIQQFQEIIQLRQDFFAELSAILST